MENFRPMRIDRDEGDHLREAVSLAHLDTEARRECVPHPPESYKTGRVHVLVLNDTAWNIVQKVRGRHPDYVFVYRRERVKNLDLEPVMQYDRTGTMNNTGWQSARAAVGLQDVRVHDLRHTFGQRLRQAGVPKEDRGLLMGHVVKDMPEHYATSTVERLVEQANKVTETRDRVTLLQVRTAEAGSGGRNPA